MFKQLYLLASGFVESSVAVFWVSMLCGIMLYVCSIFLTRSIGHEVHDSSFLGRFCKQHFGTIPLSMITLFELMSSPDLEKMEVLIDHPVVFVFFIVFIIFGSFAMLSILTGVISESMIQKGNEHAEDMRFEDERWKKAFIADAKNHFIVADENADGKMNRDEFLRYLPELADLFEDKGFHYEAKDIQVLFDLIDFDNGGLIEMEEFLAGMSCLAANAGDIPIQMMKMQYLLATQANKIEDNLNKRLDGLEKMQNNLFELVIGSKNRRLRQYPIG